jgi:hypothetical protein
MKQVVQKTIGSIGPPTQPVFTELIHLWALYNNMDLAAARPRMPKDKAPVESHLKIAYLELQRFDGGIY